jgi:hypothetical protein
MKTERISLFAWDEQHDTAYIEIDWPRVHKAIGTDRVQWILGQPRTDCQLVVERVNNQCGLVVEFYNQQSLVMYLLMWAK